MVNNEISRRPGAGDGAEPERRGAGAPGRGASGGFALTQSQGVNQGAGRSAATQMGLHADGAAAPQGVVSHARLCSCVLGKSNR